MTAGIKDGPGSVARRLRISAGLLISMLMLVIGPAAARANVPFQIINSSGPIDQITIGNDLSCQAHFKGDAVFSFYPSATSPGDCGTFLAASGSVYSPDFGSHDLTATTNATTSWTPFTAVSQTGVTGAGTAANPFKVVTVVAAGPTGVKIRQTNTYVAGRRAFNTQMELANSGGTQSVVLYHAVDCYLAESDFGFGAFNPATGGAFCAQNASNSPPGRVIGFTPLTPGSSYIESQYTTVWGAINGSAFPNTVDATVFQDNGTGISWSFSLPPGGSFRHRATASQADPEYTDSTAIDPRGFAPAKCGGKNATIIGTDLPDKLTGTRKADVIAGLGGNDKIRGLGGNDRLCGGPGKDTLIGGGGKDFLNGGGRKDRCKGGGGRDKAKGCEKKSSV
jgi:hypothetical protein